MKNQNKQCFYSCNLVFMPDLLQNIIGLKGQQLLPNAIIKNYIIQRMFSQGFYLSSQN